MVQLPEYSLLRVTSTLSGDNLRRPVTWALRRRSLSMRTTWFQDHNLGQGRPSLILYIAIDSYTYKKRIRTLYVSYPLPLPPARPRVGFDTRLVKSAPSSPCSSTRGLLTPFPWHDRLRGQILTQTRQHTFLIVYLVKMVLITYLLPVRHSRGKT